MTSFFLAAGAIILIGAIGGLINALIGDDKGFVIPKKVPVGEKVILRPGILGNVLVSSFSAFISWGLYGPLSDLDIISDPDQLAVTLTVGNLAAAGLVGVAGARWLTNEIDKKVLKEAIINATQVDPQSLGFSASASSESTTTAPESISPAKIRKSKPMEVLNMLS